MPNDRDSLLPASDHRAVAPGPLGELRLGPLLEPSERGVYLERKTAPA